MTASLEVLKKLISFDTTTSKDTLEAVNYVKTYLESFGAKTKLVYNEAKTRASLLATIGDASKPGIILSGHLDTVPCKKEEWDTDPHVLTEVGSRFYGRGTSDMKGGIACALGNIENLKSSGKTFHFALTHDEEGGFNAIKQLNTGNFDGFFKTKPLGCIVMEPTMLQPICGHKGMYLAKIKVAGVESHSAYPHLGVDALAYMVQIYNKIRELFAKHSQCFKRDGAYNPNCTTLDICTLNGGDAVNKIPGSAELSYSIRCLSGDNIKSLNYEIKSFCEVLNQEIKSKNKDCSITFTEALSINGFESDINSEFMKNFPNSTKVSYGTEAGYFQSLKINTVIFGPGSIEQAHIKNEFVEKSQLDAFDKFIQEKLCRL